MKNRLINLLFIFIAILAFYVRTYNVNWDSGTHIHPDERFLTMVTSDMKPPISFGDYLNPAVSTMNPHNINYGFFVYGTFPLYLVKVLAIFLKMDNYGEITIVGRYISAVFDTGIVVLLFLLARTLFHCSTCLAGRQVTPLLRINSHEVRKSNEAMKQLNNDNSLWLPLLPPLFYSIMVLPIQLSHFFATDTFMAFFMIASFYLSVLINKNVGEWKWRTVFFLSILLGISIGFGLASKVTMVFILPLDLLIIVSPLLHCFIASLLRNNSHEVRSSNGTMEQWNNISYFIILTICGFLIAFTSYLFFRMAMPMAFADGNFFNLALNPKWIKNLADLQVMSSDNLSNTFPPAIQWFKTTPIIFPLKNMILWGMGIPLAVMCIISLLYFLITLLLRLIRFIADAKNLKFEIFNLKSIKENQKIQIEINRIIIFLLALFTLTFFVYQGSQFVKAMRYIYSIYWCFALLGGLFISKIIDRFHFFDHETQYIASLQKKIFITLILLITAISLLVYPISFLQIYTRPHSRVTASRWIFDNIPMGSKVTFEEWDDPLPLSVDGKPIHVSGISLPMFWPDSNQKWQVFNEKLNSTDYVILSSNRAYGSITKRPDIYSQTIKFYKNLFSGETKFKKIAEFTSRPTVPFVNFEFIDDHADESFTVYDHPRVLIFKKQ